MWSFKQDNAALTRYSCRALAVNSREAVITVHTAKRGALADDGRALDIAGGSDLLVTQRDSSGGLLASLRIGDSRDEECWGAATDVQDAIWIGFASTSATAKPAREVVVRRIAP